MENLNDLINNLDLEEFSYYYHITGKGYGDDIIEKGLYMEEDDLRTTTIAIPEEMINNPEEYCLSEYKNDIVKREEMVLIGCPKGDEGSLVKPIGYDNWIGNRQLNYIIRSENILGYIDLKTLDVTYNPEYIDFSLRR